MLSASFGAADRGYLRALLVRSLGGRDAALYVDNTRGGMTALVERVSGNYSFAAFPSMQAVSSIEGRAAFGPDELEGSLVFRCRKAAGTGEVASDVKFLYGAMRRVANAAGMNMRGKVQTDVFGTMTLPEYDEHIRKYATELGFEVEIFHSNIEGEVINKFYEAHERGVNAALINPAGYTTGVGENPNALPCFCHRRPHRTGCLAIPVRSPIRCSVRRCPHLQRH